MLIMKRNFSLADRRVAMVVNQTINVLKFPKTYEMEIVGDSLRPLVESGTTLVFSKVEKPVKGDLIARYFRPDLPELSQPGAMPMVMQLAKNHWVLSERFPYRPRPGHQLPTLVCESTNPAQQLCIPADKLLAVHKCVGIQAKGSPVQASTFAAAPLKARGYLHA